VFDQELAFYHLDYTLLRVLLRVLVFAGFPGNSFLCGKLPEI
jgi:hypothetical protein